jgi:DNA-damage-inducible protein J
MAQKSANVIARIEPEIKEQAESILAEMGIPASLGINMFYHQIIKVRGLPFTPTAKTYNKSLEEMTDEEFDARMAVGLSQAQADMGSPVSETFSRLRARIKNEREAI